MGQGPGASTGGRGRRWWRLACYAAITAVMAACSVPDAPAPDAPVTDLGGPASVTDASVNAFGNASPVLDAGERSRFVNGNAFFRTNWVTAPASASARDGLGPFFQAASCSGCHRRDGRGTVPDAPGDDMGGLLMRLSVNGGTEPEPTYGWQLSPRGILAAGPEASVSVSWTTVPGAYADGTPYVLRTPEASITEPRYGAVHAHVETSLRLAQQLVGLGLLEAVDEATLLAIAARQVAEGRSGRVHYVTDRAGNRVVGRFGWKAGQPDVEHQVAAAFSGDMGLTTPLLADDNTTASERRVLGDIPHGGTPEVEPSTFADVVFYSRMLAVPRRRGATETSIRSGERHFGSMGCTSCHVPTLRTGQQALHPSYRSVDIHPYTDLLLHDMGPGLADGRPEGQADGTEWRTPPLWGIGLAAIVAGGPVTYLHDGRARSIDEAILWHGGEAADAAAAFRRATASARADLVRFVLSL